MELGFKCEYCGVFLSFEHNKIPKECPKCFNNWKQFKPKRIFDYERDRIKFWNKKISKYQWMEE